MRALNYSKDSVEFKLFGDIWALFKDNAYPESEKDYKEIVREADELVAKYNGDNFARHLALDVLEEIERRNNERR